MKPGYVTQTFSKVLDSNNLRHISNKLLSLDIDEQEIAM